MTNIPINRDRLWLSLMEMAKIGATEKGGNCRLTLSDLDKEGRDLFVDWCQQAGCSVTIDAVGNIFARRPGRTQNKPPVMMGSHLDTQPTGGRFDGVLGVLAGLEVIRTLNDNNVETEAPLELVSWTNEEGSRYSPAMMGSGVFAGVFSLDDVYAKTDIDGKFFGDELKRIGYAGPEKPGAHDVSAYFELHIEQGPILEAEEKTIGIVTRAQGQRWYEITIIGQESHAGPTPMPRRRDSLVAGSKIIQEVQNIGHRYAPNACATVGHIQAYPNSRNVIPGKVFLTVDFRHPDDNQLTTMDTDLKTFCNNLELTDNIKVDLVNFWHFPATLFDDDCIEAVKQGAKIGGYQHMEIVSGAGHDAVYLAGKVPTAMIFVPCENGISHNEIENVTPEDCSAGCQVLLHAVLTSAESQN